MLSEGNMKILGGSTTFISYLCNSKPSIKNQLYPVDSRAEIEKHLAWFQARIKPTSTRLVKMIVQPKAFGDKPPSQQELQREQEEFFKKLLPTLDKQLEQKRFFCGPNVTIADIQYYCEIVTIVSLTKKELSEGDFPNLAPWFHERMSKIPELAALDKKMIEILVKYNFQ